jgi:hypothetical protein
MPLLARRALPLDGSRQEVVKHSPPLAPSTSSACEPAAQPLRTRDRTPKALLVWCTPGNSWGVCSWVEAIGSDDARRASGGNGGGVHFEAVTLNGCGFQNQAVKGHNREMTTRAKRPTKPPGTCIFCNGLGLTKEHIWSDWLSAVIPKNQAYGYTWGKIESKAGSAEWEWTVPVASGGRQGCILQKKIRRVCGACNSGWMSQVVAAAKPAVKRMVLGQSSCLSQDEQRSVASWIAITTIVQEFANVSRIQRIPSSHRAFLYEHKVPPPDWSIWVGEYSGTWWHPMGHYHIPMRYRKATGRTPGDLLGGDLQLTTFMLGRMLVHVFTATEMDMVQDYRSYIEAASQPKMLPQMWPELGENLVWPPDNPFDDDAADRLIFNWIEKRWGVDGLSDREERKLHEVLQKIKEMLDAAAR